MFLFIYLFSVCCNQALEFNQIYLYSVINIYNCNFKIHLYKSQCKRIYYIILNVNYVHTYVRPALTKKEKIHYIIIKSLFNRLISRVVRLFLES